MKGPKWNEKLFAAHRNYIELEEVRRAFDFLTAAAFESALYSVNNGGLGQQKKSFDYDEVQTKQRPFAFIVNLGHLLFYIRRAGRQRFEGGISLFRKSFATVNENPNGEWTIRIETLEEAKRLHELVFGTPHVRSESEPRKLSRLTSRDAVLEAIAESQSLGRDVFLAKYGYKPSRLYPLKYNDQIYDSKAIAGVAVGKQHGTPLKWKEFSGGVATVVRVLKRLGFDLGDNVQPLQYLSPGTIYFRKDLVAWFGGQLQGGIWTPREFDVIFIFSGESGKEFGYQDGWTDQGVFRYTGEGQVGDMTFTGGNKAIRDHREDGKDLLLFEDLGKGKGVRYSGLFECAGVETVEGVDRDRNARQIIVFDLVPVKSAAVASDVEVAESSPPLKRTLEELRAAAYAAAKAPGLNQKTSDVKRSWYERSTSVRDFVLARANGFCEACDEKAPFLKKNGTPYLEPHHTHRLADEGPDHPAWVGAICPTCHRRIHSGQDGVEWNTRLKERLQAKEP